MSKLQGQKPKILYLLKILLEETDAEHGLSMPQIIHRLSDYGVPAERKSIYTDFDCLREYGYDVRGESNNRSFFYKIVDREFDLPELKLLVDAVQASRFISPGKSAALIKKLEKQTSEFNAKQLQRHVYLGERVKSANESGFGNVDRIHSALIAQCKISFRYLKWNADKQLVPCHDNKRYVVSPWAVTWSDENYYLIAYDADEKIIKHFRIDKMKDIAPIEGEAREGQELFEQFDLAIYAKKTFGMFGGEETEVTLTCENDMVGVIIDRFGKGVELKKVDDGHFAVTVSVYLSLQFFGWVISLGNGVKITAPDTVVAKLKKEIARLQKAYK